MLARILYLRFNRHQQRRAGGPGERSPATDVEGPNVVGPGGHLSQAEVVEGAGVIGEGRPPQTMLGVLGRSSCSICPGRTCSISAAAAAAAAEHGCGGWTHPIGRTVTIRWRREVGDRKGHEFYWRGICAWLAVGGSRFGSSSDIRSACVYAVDNDVADVAEHTKRKHAQPPPPPKKKKRDHFDHLDLGCWVSRRTRILESMPTMPFSNLSPKIMAPVVADVASDQQAPAGRQKTYRSGSTHHAHRSTPSPGESYLPAGATVRVARCC